MFDLYIKDPKLAEFDYYAISSRDYFLLEKIGKESGFDYEIRYSR